MYILQLWWQNEDTRFRSARCGSGTARNIGYAQFVGISRLHTVGNHSRFGGPGVGSIGRNRFQVGRLCESRTTAIHHRAQAIPRRCGRSRTKCKQSRDSFAAEQGHLRAYPRSLERQRHKRDRPTTNRNQLQAGPSGTGQCQDTAGQSPNHTVVLLHKSTYLRPHNQK